MIESPTNSSKLVGLLKNALTDEIHSREMYMKGIDYSYYYEGRRGAFRQRKWKVKWKRNKNR